MDPKLYLFNGKDYWIVPKFNKKKIIMINIHTKKEIIYPFQTKSAAKENFESWLEHQEQRLPITFLYRSRHYDSKSIALFKKLGIKKQNSSKLRKFLLFHKDGDTYFCDHVDEPQIIFPIINYMDLKRITAHQNELTRHTIDDFTPKEGLFA